MDTNQMNMINLLKSDKYKRKLQRMLVTITHTHIPVHLTMTTGQGSYASIKNNSFHVNIDPLMVMSEEDETIEKLWMKCKGLLAHECGHILYTDFEVSKENVTELNRQKEAIPLIAEKISDEKFDENSTEGKKLLTELKQGIYDYVYCHNLIKMLNSIEDGAIECILPAYKPCSYGDIVATRNYIHEKEEKFLKKKSPILNRRKNDAEMFLGEFITEIRHYAVIGYRKELHPVFLPSILSSKQIKDIEELCLYARMGSKDTRERNAISKVLLDMLEPLLKEKADKFYQKYMDMLKAGEKGLLSSMLSDDMGPSDDELSITGNLDPSLAGKTKPQPNRPSEYDMSLPKRLNDKVNEKLKEQLEENEDNHAGNMNSADEENSNNSHSADSSLENQESKTTEKDMEAGSNNQNSQEQDESGVSKGKREEKSEAKEGEDEKEENFGGVDEQSEGYPDDTDENNYCESMNQDEQKEEIKEGNSSLKDKKIEELKAENACNESLKRLEKSFQKEIINEFKQGVASQKNGKAPTMEDDFGQIDSISNMHQGIKTSYCPSKNIEIPKYDTNLIHHLNVQASRFSSKLKEIILFQSKTRRKNGLKRGVINDASLGRIITDQKVFRKTIKGVEKKARLAVLIDLSGSMKGKKEENAKNAAYMLATACEKIKVPISIMGHTTDFDRVMLFHFVEFENYLDKKSKYKLYTKVSMASNRDGLAIFHSATDLVRHRHPNEQLVLLVISDGAPAATNYYGESAYKDIRNILNAFEKQYGVKTIGIGIGDDTESVSEIYQNHVLVPDVENLDKELLNILKSLLIK